MMMKYKIGLEIVLIFLLFASYSLSFSLNIYKSCFAVHRTFSLSTPSSGVSYVTLFAKKGKASSKTRKGFGKPVATATNNSSEEEEDAVKEVSSSGSSTSEATTTPTQATRPAAVVIPTTESTRQDKDDDDILEAVYSRYKGSAIKANQEDKKKKAKKIVDEEGFGGKVLAKIPLPLQEKIDNMLLWGTSLTLTTVILIGLAASSGALKVVYPDVHIPEAADRFIQDTLIPALTPMSALFLFFSVTFGLFKYAQISSNETTYREE